jgi:polysaccharide transporter, PST family
VALVLGAKWLEVAPIFAALAAAAIVQPISATFIWLLVSQGRRQELRQWSVVGSVLSGLAIVAGLKGGAVGVAATYAACEVFLRFPLLTWIIGRRGAVGARHVFRALGPGMAMSASIAGVNVLLPHFAKATGATGLAVSLATSVVAAAFTLAAMPSGRRAFNDVLQAVRAGSPSRANHAEAVLL